MRVTCQSLRHLVVSGLVFSAFGGLSVESQGLLAVEPAHGKTSVASSQVKPVSESRDLADLLADESKGQAVDRGAALSQAISEINEKSRKDPLRWQAGWVFSNGKWVQPADLSQDSLSESVRAYKKFRGENELDQAGHRRMAVYASQKGLTEQADAHWYGVLNSDPSNQEARSALGFVRFDNRWLSPRERQVIEQANETTFTSLKNWMPKVRVWAKALQGNDTKKRLAAIEQLKHVKDPSVVNALVVAVPQVDETVAVHFVNAIARFKNKEATLTLASIAVSDPASSPGKTAIAALKALPQESYVPELLDLMSTELAVQDQLVTHPNGALVLRVVQERELRTSKQIAQLDKLMYLDENADGIRSVRQVSNVSLTDRSLTRTQLGFVIPTNPVARQVAVRESERLSSSVRSEVNRLNSEHQKVQSSIASTLRNTTGQSLDDSAIEWWSWWDKSQDSFYVGPKDFQVRRYEDYSNPIVIPEERVVSMALPAMRHECLVAGTLIPTEVGLRPIESIRVGDRVVSQNIESGALELKPVLRTTLRQPAATQSITLASGETIRSTLGHPWWVIGTGWTKTRDLTPEMHIRTPAGAVAVARVEPSDEIETHNLVVADNSSYFVGESQILSFDASDFVHTFQKSPGLAVNPLQ